MPQTFLLLIYIFLNIHVFLILFLFYLIYRLRVLIVIRICRWVCVWGHGDRGRAWMFSCDIH